MKIEENYSLLSYNTFGIEAKTRWFISYDSIEDLLKILSDEYFLSEPVFHMGGGSNLLFLGDYNGIILHSEIKDMEMIGEDADHVHLKAGAGIVWDELVSYTVEKGWGGLENLSGIPGEVGASAVQNIGAYGSEVKDVLAEVIAYDMHTGAKRIFSNEECCFAYRDSNFKKEWKGKYIITHVIYRLSKKPVYNIEYGNLKETLSGSEINLKTVREAVLSIRASKLPDPKVVGNAGSFFTNPFVEMPRYKALKELYPSIPSFPVSDEKVKIPAAWLIDQCGLKGYQEGNVGVHGKQPLVLVNNGGATGREVAQLAEKVRETVLHKFDIDITPEVTYIL